MGKVPATFYFDDIQLYELDVFSPPPPSPPPPPNVLLWLDAEGGPNGAQVVVSQGERGELASDLSSKAAAHEGSYGFELTVKKVFAQDWFAMLSLPPFLVTDHLRMYSLTFWAKASADPKPRPHIAFQVRGPGVCHFGVAFRLVASLLRPAAHFVRRRGALAALPAI
jgi:hypothetical protein